VKGSSKKTEKNFPSPYFFAEREENKVERGGSPTERKKRSFRRKKKKNPGRLRRSGAPEEGRHQSLGELLQQGTITGRRV